MTPENPYAPPQSFSLSKPRRGALTLSGFFGCVMGLGFVPFVFAAQLAATIPPRDSPVALWLPNALLVAWPYLAAGATAVYAARRERSGESILWFRPLSPWISPADCFLRLAIRASVGCYVSWWMLCGLLVAAALVTGKPVLDPAGVLLLFCLRLLVAVMVALHLAPGELRRRRALRNGSPDGGNRGEN